MLQRQRSTEREQRNIKMRDFPSIYGGMRNMQCFLSGVEQLYAGERAKTLLRIDIEASWLGAFRELHFAAVAHRFSVVIKSVSTR